MQSQQFWLARDRLIRSNAALELVRGLGDEVEVPLRKVRDDAKAEVERLLPDAYRADLERQRTELSEANQKNPEMSAFRDAAIVIGVATVAAIGIAPIAAWVVKEAIVKELVKAAVSGLFVGVATAAAEGALARHHRHAATVTTDTARESVSSTQDIPPQAQGREPRPRRFIVPGLGEPPSVRDVDDQDQNRKLLEKLEQEANDLGFQVDQLGFTDQVYKQDGQYDQGDGLTHG